MANLFPLPLFLFCIVHVWRRTENEDHPVRIMFGVFCSCFVGVSAVYV